MAKASEYQPVYSDVAAHSIVSLPKRRAQKALNVCHTLARNPFVVADFTIADESGRPIDHLLVDGLIITYYVDHAVRQVFTAEVEAAD